MTRRKTKALVAFALFAVMQSRWWWIKQTYEVGKLVVSLPRTPGFLMFLLPFTNVEVSGFLVLVGKKAFDVIDYIPNNVIQKKNIDHIAYIILVFRRLLPSMCYYQRWFVQIFTTTRFDSSERTKCFCLFGSTSKLVSSTWRRLHHLCSGHQREDVGALRQKQRQKIQHI